MPSTAIIEGNLIEPRPGAPGWRRQISADVAWEIDSLEDLENLPSIKRVETDLDHGFFTLHYAPDCIPPGLQRLRGWLRAGQPFGLWRLASLAADLCDALAQIHGEGIPQLVVHPGRIARQDKAFTLLPMLATRLPQLHEFLVGARPEWVRFMAPEVLRSRAIGVCLRAGGVFALGKVLGFLADPASPSPEETAYAIAERIVESVDSTAAGAVLQGLEGFHRLTARMCARAPANRLDLIEAAGAFRALAQGADPALVLAGLAPLPARETAAAIAADLEQTEADGVFHLDSAHAILARVDALLTSQPPEPEKALAELRAAGGCTNLNPAAALREARAHALAGADPEHLQQASCAFGRVCSIMEPPALIEQEWCAILDRMTTREAIVEGTEELHPARAPIQIVCRRVEALLALQEGPLAWSAVTSVLPFRRFDQTLMNLARRAAKDLSNDFITHWITQCRTIPGMAAGVAVAWERLGNIAQAAPYLAAAKTWQPPTPKSKT